MSYHVRRARVRDRGTIRKLHQQTFGGTADMVDPERGYWWIAWKGETPVGFAGFVNSARTPKGAYFNRAGVLRSHRGHGLQLRLIRARERLAQRLGLSPLISDTTDNPHSAANLTKAGFTPYEPQVPWGLSSTVYWRKALG